MIIIATNTNVEYRCTQAEKDVVINRFNVETDEEEIEWFFNRMSLEEIFRTMKAGNHVMLLDGTEDAYHVSDDDNVEENYLNVRCDKMTSNKLRDRYQSLFGNK